MTHLLSVEPAPEQATEPWRQVFRNGFAPHLPVAGLIALREALVEDDHRLIQANTTWPPAFGVLGEGTVSNQAEGACAIGYCGWQGETDRQSVASVEEFFMRLCDKANAALDELTACAVFLNWHDDTPRDEMRRLLVPEVDRELRRRGVAVE